MSAAAFSEYPLIEKKSFLILNNIQSTSSPFLWELKDEKYLEFLLMAQEKPKTTNFKIQKRR